MRLIYTVVLAFIFSISVAEKLPKYIPNTISPDVDTALAKANPHYKERAGSFYEVEYLGKSAKNLFEICDLDPKYRPTAMDILRCFIYDWLDHYIRDNGEITTDHKEVVIDKLDERLSQFLTKDQMVSFHQWKIDHENNLLNFLFITNKIEKIYKQ